MPAENTAEFILCDYYYKKILGLSNGGRSFRQLTGRLIRMIKKLINNFETDPEFSIHQSQFKSSISLYIPIFEDNTGHRTLFMEELVGVFNEQTYIQTDTEVLNSLKLENWAEISQTNNLDSSFIQLLGNSVIRGIYENIVQDYPYYEFKIAVLLSAIYYNSLLLDLNGLNTNINILRTNLNINCSHVIERVDKALENMSSNFNRCYINSDGTIMWDLLLSGLNESDVNNIKSLFKITNIIINNVTNQISLKKQGLKNFVYDLDIQ